MLPLPLYILLVIFVATLMRSTFGFGEALVSVPLLALRVPLPIAVPLAVLYSITVAAMVVIQDHHHIEVRSAKWLILASLPGIPLGLWLLARADPRLVKALLAALLLCFSTYSLLGHTPHLRNDRRRWLLLAGFISGLFGGAYGMNGPPLAIYGSLRRWPAQQFRATLQAYFLPASLVGLFGYWSTGLLTASIGRNYLLCLPGAILAIFLGRSLNRRLKGKAFLRYIHIALILIALTLVYELLFKTPR